MRRLFLILCILFCGIVYRFSHAAEAHSDNHPKLTESEAKFTDLTTALLKRLPKKAGIQLPPQHSLPPVAAVEVGDELGKVEDAIDKEPSLSVIGFRFYRSCALDETLWTPARVTCLSNYMSRTKKDQTFEKIDWKEFPEEIRKKAEDLL